MSAPSACLRLVSQMMTFLSYRRKIGTLFPFFFSEELQVLTCRCWFIISCVLIAKLVHGICIKL